MRQAKIFFKDMEAGIIIQHDNGSFVFRYNDAWMADSSKPGISLTLPKNKQEYSSKHLFSFFYNMLPEGSNKEVVCKYNRIDHDDHFGILITVANNDNIGAVSVEKIDSP